MIAFLVGLLLLLSGILAVLYGIGIPCAMLFDVLCGDEYRATIRQEGLWHPLYIAAGGFGLTGAALAVLFVITIYQLGAAVLR